MAASILPKWDVCVSLNQRVEEVFPSWASRWTHLSTLREQFSSSTLTTSTNAQTTADVLRGPSRSSVTAQCTTFHSPSECQQDNWMYRDRHPIFEKEIMIKASARSSAGYTPEPIDIRTESTLVECLRYMCETYLDPTTETKPDQCEEWDGTVAPMRSGSIDLSVSISDATACQTSRNELFTFLEDRLRAIRKDFVTQGILSRAHREAVETMVRIHILRIAECTHTRAECEAFGRYKKLNHERLVDCFGHILPYYREMAPNDKWQLLTHTHSSNHFSSSTKQRPSEEAVLLASSLSLFLLLGGIGHTNEDSAQWWHSTSLPVGRRQLLVEVERCFFRTRPFLLSQETDPFLLSLPPFLVPELVDSIEAINAVESSLWGRYLEILSKTSFFQATLMYSSLAFIRVRFMYDMFVARIPGTRNSRFVGELPISYISRILLFEDVAQCLDYLDGFESIPYVYDTSDSQNVTDHAHRSIRGVVCGTTSCLRLKTCKTKLMIPFHHFLNPKKGGATNRLLVTSRDPAIAWCSTANSSHHVGQQYDDAKAYRMGRALHALLCCTHNTNLVSVGDSVDSRIPTAIQERFREVLSVLKAGRGMSGSRDQLHDQEFESRSNLPPLARPTLHFQYDTPSSWVDQAKSLPTQEIRGVSEPKTPTSSDVLITSGVESHVSFPSPISHHQHEKVVPRMGTDMIPEKQFFREASPTEMKSTRDSETEYLLPLSHPQSTTKMFPDAESMVVRPWSESLMGTEATIVHTIASPSCDDVESLRCSSRGETNREIFSNTFPCTSTTGAKPDHPCRFPPAPNVEVHQTLSEASRIVSEISTFSNTEETDRRSRSKRHRNDSLAAFSDTSVEVEKMCSRTAPSRMSSPHLSQADRCPSLNERGYCSGVQSVISEPEAGATTSSNQGTFLEYKSSSVKTEISDEEYDKENGMQIVRDDVGEDVLYDVFPLFWLSFVVDWIGRLLPLSRNASSFEPLASVSWNVIFVCFGSLGTNDSLAPFSRAVLQSLDEGVQCSLRFTNEVEYRSVVLSLQEVEAQWKSSFENTFGEAVDGSLQHVGCSVIVLWDQTEPWFQSGCRGGDGHHCAFLRRKLQKLQETLVAWCPIRNVRFFYPGPTNAKRTSCELYPESRRESSIPTLTEDSLRRQTYCCEETIRRVNRSVTWKTKLNPYTRVTIDPLPINGFQPGPEENWCLPLLWDVAKDWMCCLNDGRPSFHPYQW